MSLDLPDLIEMGAYGGDWDRYCAALYDIFRHDYLLHPPGPVRGRRWACKRHPLVDGKEATFWHFTSEGMVEADRTPDMRRCERIGWAPRIFNALADDALIGTHLHVWEQPRGGERRVAVAVEDFEYVVVFADRKDYVLPWTGYYVEHEHRRRKLRKQWEEFALDVPWESMAPARGGGA